MARDGSTAQGLSQKMTPELVKYLWANGHVTQAYESLYGTALDCDNYVQQATEEELEERRRAVQRTAARLFYDGMAKERARNQN